MITLNDLGYNSDFDELLNLNNNSDLQIGRVISEHKERYIVKTSENELDAEIIGNMRFTAQNRNDFPVVGDWVAISIYDNDKAIIYKILPRKNKIERQAVGKFGEKQIIASNIDYSFIIQSVDRDFSINRIERYLTICFEAKVVPIIIINKIDLVNASELQLIEEQINKRITDIKIIYSSNETKFGFDEILKIIEKGKTYCLLGSSGVGKSTLINNLLGNNIIKTNDINNNIQRGKHTTTRRELFILENGGLLIDNPGMREVGIANAEKSLNFTFNHISELSERCKFSDCKHINEAGCAVIEAVEKGIIDENVYNNYIKLLKEQKHFEMNLMEKKKKDKKLGKIVKHYKKHNQK